MSKITNAAQAGIDLDYHIDRVADALTGCCGEAQASFAFICLALARNAAQAAPAADERALFEAAYWKIDPHAEVVWVDAMWDGTMGKMWQARAALAQQAGSGEAAAQVLDARYREGYSDGWNEGRADLAASPAPETAQADDCRYCGGDGEHYQGPSRYVVCESCDGTGKRAAHAQQDAAQGRASAMPLPCPFCGDTEEVYGAGNGMGTYCDNCGASGPDHEREGKPVATWNDRAPSAATGKAAAANAGGLTATHGPLRLTNMKTADIAGRGYNIVGYVLRREDGEEVCISAESAVRWLPQEHYWRLMHEQDGSLFAATSAADAKDAALLEAKAMFENILERGPTVPTVRDAQKGIRAIDAASQKGGA